MECDRIESDSKNADTENDTDNEIVNDIEPDSGNDNEPDSGVVEGKPSRIHDPEIKGMVEKIRLYI